MRSLLLAGLVALASASIAAAGNEKITYTKDIAPVLNANCVSCHRAGEIGPFAMTDYESIRPWAKSIRRVVTEKTMPPWHADSSKVKYANDRSLSPEHIELISKWVLQGAAKGEEKDLPPAPVFDETWAMGPPDKIFTAETEYTVPPETDYIEYQSVHFKCDIPEDLYVTGWEIRPTERKVVHHANLVRAPLKLKTVGIGGAVGAGGDYIGSYLPGARPMSYPEGTALRIPKGSQISIQVHYVGIDKPLTDRMMFGVKLAQGRVDKIIRTVGTDDYEIEIAPGGNFTMDTSVNLLYDLTLLSSGAHMHLRGRAYNATALLPDGTEKLITDVPVYDFNWQSNYQLAEPINVPKGTKYKIHAWWDNSANNPNNPAPDQKVVYGEWTENEMLTTWSHAVLTDEKLGLKVKDGVVIGKFDDAQATEHPAILQSLPNTFNMKAKASGD